MSLLGVSNSPEMHETGRIRRSVGWMQLDRAARILIGMMQVSLVARYLGAESFGSLNTALYIAAIVAGPATLGMDVVLVRWLVAVPETAGRAIATAIALRFISGMIAVMGTVGVGLLSSGSHVSQLAMIASLTSIAQVPLVLDAWFRARVQACPSVVAQFSAFFWAFFFRLVLIATGAPLSLFAFAAVLEMGLTAACLYLAYRRFDGPALEGPSVPLAGALLYEAWPLVVSSIAVTLLTRIDLLLLQHLAGAAKAGYYAAAMRITELFYFVPVTIVTAFTPHLLRVHQRSRAEFCSQFSALVSLLGWLGVVSTLGWLVGAPLLVRVVYGREYEATGAILRVLACINIPVNCAIAWGVFWLAERRQGTVMLLALIGTAACAGVCCVLIPVLGTTGAALGAIGGQLVPFFVIAAIPGLRDVMGATVRGMLCPLPAIRLGWGLLRGGEGL